MAAIDRVEECAQRGGSVDGDYEHGAMTDSVSFEAAPLCDCRKKVVR